MSNLKYVLLWYCVWVTIPSSHLERVMTSPEVERSMVVVYLGKPPNRYALAWDLFPTSRSSFD